MAAIKKEILDLGKVFETSFLSFIAILAFGVYEFILPIFTEDRTESLAFVGIIVSLVYAASLLAEIPVGLAVDKHGRIKVLLAAMAAMGVLGLVYFFTNSFTGIIFLNCIRFPDFQNSDTAVFLRARVVLLPRMKIRKRFL